MYAITETPPVKARPHIDTDVLFSIQPELLNDSYIYVHCNVGKMSQEVLIRIWKSTFLIGRAGEGKAGLIHAENITYAPVWTIVPENLDYVFLLIFNGLPKSCKVFDRLSKLVSREIFMCPI